MIASPKFCVVGAGAIGGVIATLLARSGASVSLVARGRTLAAVKRDGLRLFLNGELLHARVKASEDPSELGIQSYVIIAVKAPSMPLIAPRIAPLLGPETAVVTAMNGIPWWFSHNAKSVLAGRRLDAIDPDGSIARAIPARRVIGGVVYIAASVDEPGIIRHHGGRRLLIGEPDGRLTPRLERLAYWLRRAGLDSQESRDIRRDVWLKLLANLGMNPISLLTTTTSDQIIGDPLVRALCISMMKEAAQIGAAIGISDIPPVRNVIEQIRSLGKFKMSMLQDLEHHKPIEIDALLTVTRDIGRQVGVPTPFIDGILGLTRLRANSLGLLDGHAVRDLRLFSRMQPRPTNSRDRGTARCKLCAPAAGAAH